MSSQTRFDLSLVTEKVAVSHSWRSLALSLGMTYPSSAVYRNLRPFCTRHSIDTSHFTGQQSARGKRFLDRHRDIQDYLNNEQPIGSHDLKLKLLAAGLKVHQCEVCKRTEWNDRPIPIQLHHIDGNSGNNALANLQIICPNCHAQTSSYCSKNRRRSAQREVVTDEQLLQLVPQCENLAQVLRDAGLCLSQSHYKRLYRLLDLHMDVRLRSPKRLTPISHTDSSWRNHPRPRQRKFKRPSTEELRKLVWSKASSQVAVDLGITDTLLCNWCKKAGIEKPPRGYWNRRAAGETHDQALTPITRPVPVQQKRLMDTQVIEILDLLRSGELSLRTIGSRFDVRHQTVMKIRDGVAYKHVSRELASPAGFAPTTEA